MDGVAGGFERGEIVGIDKFAHIVRRLVVGFKLVKAFEHLEMRFDSKNKRLAFV